jgi:transcriptional regulator with XRE-family HTH domain
VSLDKFSATAQDPESPMAPPTFATILRRFRMEKRMSQARLADGADFNHSYVSRLESGARAPTRDAVERLSRSMSLAQVDEDTLLAAAGFLPRNTLSLLHTEPEFAEMLRLLQDGSLHPDHTVRLRRLVRQLNESFRGLTDATVSVKSSNV